MACVTEVYGYTAPRSNSPLPFGYKGFTRIAIFAAAGLIAASWIITTISTLETVVPAFTPVSPVMRHVSLTTSQALAVVDHKIDPSQRIRQGFIKAYTAGGAYSNLDRSDAKSAGDEPIIAEIRPDSVIEVKPVDTASLIELRADRVHREEPSAESAGSKQSAETAGRSVVAYASNSTASDAAASFSKIEPLSQAEEMDAAEKQADLPSGTAVPVPQLVPDRKAKVAAEDETAAAFLPDDVPLPGAKPPLRRSRMPQKVELAYAPESGATEELRSDPFSPLLDHASRSKVAVYDISAATVYLPSGERLEAHSGLGQMRDNPRYVNRKNRGPTPPHTYDLRMREALFHGVEAIRLTPVDGKNRYNRDGLLAHTFMLGRRGDSNGCVVFKDYSRFLRAFKRGEFNKLVVVARMPTSKSARIASLF